MTRFLCGFAVLACSAWAEAPVRYLALGDSFTIGTGSGADKAFPARVAAKAERKVQVKNLAVNGFSTDDLIEVELPEVAGFSPDVVTLAIGANDIVRGRGPEGYRKNLKAIFRSLIRSGVPSTRVYCLPQPDWSRSPTARAFGDAAGFHAEIVEYNRIMQEEAVAAGAHWVDLFPLMEQQAKAQHLAPDGLHPDARSHDEWADALLAQGFLKR